MNSEAGKQLIRLASDQEFIYQDAWRWFVRQGPPIAPVLIEGLDDSRLGSVAHWRILLVLREFALPSTLPAILKSLRLARERRDPIVIPGAMEAVAAFPPEQSVPVMDLLLDSPDTDDVQHAAALLGNVGSELAVNSIKRLFSRPELQVRKSAVRALLRVNSPSAREALERHRLEEPDPEIRALMGPSGT